MYDSKITSAIFAGSNNIVKGVIVLNRGDFTGIDSESSKADGSDSYIQVKGGKFAFDPSTLKGVTVDESLNFVPDSDGNYVKGYNVNIAETVGASITFSPAPAAEGATVTITAIPEGKNTVQRVKVNKVGPWAFPSSVDVTKSDDAENTYTFNMPGEDVNVSADINIWYGREEEGENPTCKFKTSDGKTYYYDSILYAINDTQFDEGTGTITMLRDETINEERFHGEYYTPYTYNGVTIKSQDENNPCTINLGKRTSQCH